MRGVAPAQVLGHHDRREGRADLDLLVEQAGGLGDGLLGGTRGQGVGDGQKVPRRSALRRSSGPAEQHPLPPRADEQVGQVVPHQVPLVGREHDRLREHDAEHLADQWRGDQVGGAGRRRGRPERAPRAPQRRTRRGARERQPGASFVLLFQLGQRGQVQGRDGQARDGAVVRRGGLYGA